MTSSDKIDISRLQRIERAWRIAAAESNGLLQQLLEPNQRLSHLQGNVAATQRRAAAYRYGDRPLTGEDPYEWQERALAAQRLARRRKTNSAML